MFQSSINSKGINITMVEPDANRAWQTNCEDNTAILQDFGVMNAFVFF